MDKGAMNMKRVFAAVYVLVLAVQMPHVASAYASLEQPGWYQWTAWLGALAFEASIAAFTYRIVVERSKRRTTRAGLMFFLLASCVANATYYGLAPQVFAWLMPVFATVALPASLALFASEFGAEVQREERRAARLGQSQLVTDSVTTDAQPKSEPSAAPSAAMQSFLCSCGYAARNRYALSAHMKAHSNGHGVKVAEVV